jgi:hypothetical protein
MGKRPDTLPDRSVLQALLQLQSKVIHDAGEPGGYRLLDGFWSDLAQGFDLVLIYGLVIFQGVGEASEGVKPELCVIAGWKVLLLKSARTNTASDNPGFPANIIQINGGFDEAG